jgi:3',5'-cyclic AMP phosphodiesterase CpdA
MKLIVHLTDLHLGSGGASLPADDRKVHVISDSERTSLREVAEEQLKRLADKIHRQGETISALILSGDITVQGKLGGYEELAEFLNISFGKLLPPPGRIVATPGNHDVAWFETDPAKRYEHFVTYCVKAGYVTPPLDGIDLVEGKRWSPAAKHFLIDDEGWFIVPLNSSNWSGTRAKLVDAKGHDLPESDVDTLRTMVASNPKSQALVEQLLKLRHFDMARVSKRQLQAFTSTVTEAKKKLDKEDVLPLAVMHHQLSPIGTREEIKPFESLSNLGRVRLTMEEAGIAVALHGHKHDFLTMWNTTERGSLDGRAKFKHEMLVVSGGTIGGSPVPNISAFATVLEVAPMLQGHEVRVRSLGDYLSDYDTGTRAYYLTGKRFEPLGPRGGHLEASGFSDGYARLLAEADARRGDTVKNLSITINDLAEVNAPPKGYPQDASGERGVLPLHEWFNQVADWWQSELIEAPRGLFTHGRRLRLHHGKPDADQIVAMVATLKDRRPTNGRAIATLIDPGPDLLTAVPAAPASFPAFCLVQLHIRTEGASMFLDATAYFRKQEMRYWWPINIAEIKRVMEAVRRDLKGIKLGSITTMAAVAVWQTSRSRVSVPAVDRMYLQDEEGRQNLMRLAALIAVPLNRVDKTECARLRHLWNVVLEDIVPPAEAVTDSIPVAVEGVRFLKEAVKAQEACADDPLVRKRLSTCASALATLEERGRALSKLGKTAKTQRTSQELADNVAAMSKARDELSTMLCELTDDEAEAPSGKNT